MAGRHRDRRGTCPVLQVPAAGGEMRAVAAGGALGLVLVVLLVFLRGF